MPKTRSVDAVYMTELVESYDTMIEAAEAMSVHPGSLSGWMRNGKCPPVVERVAELLLDECEEGDKKLMLIQCPEEHESVLRAFLGALKIRVSVL